MAKILADYVIVGAGTAGSVLATSLAKKGYKVVVLEGGKRLLDNPNVLNPLGFLGIYNTEAQNISPPDDPYFAWQVFSEPDSGAYGARTLYAVGRQWGGSSAINTMLYVNGGSTLYNQDYPEGWNYRDLVGYFASVENAIKPYRSTEKKIITQVLLGALRNIRQQQINEGGTNWLTNVNTGNNLSNIESPDPNAPQINYNDLIGLYNVCAFSQYFFFINKLPDGTFIRKFAGNTYLGIENVRMDGKGRGKYKTLHIVSDALVNRLITKKNKIKGVSYTNVDGEESEAYAKREVILCAGATETPAILQRSGIGTLQRIDRPIVVPNPEVGNNLHNTYSPEILIQVQGSDVDVAAFMQETYVPNPGNLLFWGGGFFNFHPYDPNKPNNWEAVSYRKYQLLYLANIGILPAQVIAAKKFPPTNNYLVLAMDDVRFSPSGYIQVDVSNEPLMPAFFYDTFVDYTPTSPPTPAQLKEASIVESATISGLLAYDIAYVIGTEMNTYAQNQGYNVTLQILYPDSALLTDLHTGIQKYKNIWWYFLFPTLLPPDVIPDPAFTAVLNDLKYSLRVVAHFDTHVNRTAKLEKVVDTKLNVIGTKNLRIVDMSVATMLGGNPAALAMTIGAKAGDIIDK